MNLIVQDSFRSCIETSLLIDKVKSIVTFFKHSNRAANLLRSELVKAGMNENLKLKQECITRWNSKYIMIKRFIDMYLPVLSALGQLDSAPSMCDRSELNALKDITVVLYPFIKVTEELSADHYVTISLVIPTITCMKAALFKSEPNSEIGKQLKDALSFNIAKRFRNVEQNKIVSIATILDPRFKRADFESPLACASAITKIDSYLRKNEQTLPTTTTFTVDETDDFWETHSQNVKRLENGNNLSDVSSALKQYLKAKILPRSTNPIEYWFQSKTNFPELYEIACTYLSIPASSVPCERLFSKAGYIINDKRNRIDPKHVNEICEISSCPQRIIDQIKIEI